jgi:predicted choloylglycine hydrolase
VVGNFIKGCLGVLEVVLVWEVNLVGSYYDLGYELGLQLRGKRPRILAAMRDLSEGQLTFARECEIHVKQACPQLVEELHGLAEGGGFEYDRVATLEWSLVLPSACTVFAISRHFTQGGKTIVARNYDWLEETLGDNTIIHTQPLGGCASLGFTTVGVGRECGINEAGLVIGSTSVSYSNMQPGVFVTAATRWMLDTCRNVTEASRFLQSIPKVAGFHFLLADADDNIVCVESCPEKTHITPIRGGFAAIANHFNSREMQDYGPPVPQHSINRVKMLHDWFQNRYASIDIEYVKRAQRNHETDMCCHAEEAGQKLATCWAWITEIRSGRMLVTDGWPCKNRYQEHSLK